MSKRTCLIQDCTNRIHARGWCSRHYWRWYKYGDPKHPVKRKRGHKRVWPNDITKAGDCLIWKFNQESTGYGRVYVGQQQILAHRYAWAQEFGEIPAGMLVDHVCHNRLCVNTSHLRLATRQQNNSNRKGATKESSTGVRNVYPTGDRFYVMVRKDSRLRYFGTYDTLQEAADTAYNARQQLFGEFAGGR